MRQHPANIRVRIRGQTLYQGVTVDTTNRPHVRTPVGGPQTSAHRATAIAATHLRANNEKTPQRG